MSHAATAWAIGIRGLSPAQKLVLLALCDCHNPAYGCFPSQDHLADVCEISRRSVNYHLAALEARGLIERRPSVDPVTRRQVATTYRLGFEMEVPPPTEAPPRPASRRRRKADEAPSEATETRPSAVPVEAGAVCKIEHEPCAKSRTSRVQDLHTNLVKEPLREPVTRAREAILAFITDAAVPPDPGWCLDDLMALEVEGRVSAKAVMAAKHRLSASAGVPGARA